MARVNNNLSKAHEFTVEDARIIFKNFQGAETEYNAKGNRKFGLLLDDDLAEALKEDGWRVKYLKPRDEEEARHPQAWLDVKVKYGKIPPIIVLITSTGKKRLTEENVGQLDHARAKNIDLIIRPYNYPETNLRPAGISAYLKSLYFTVDENRLEEKYGYIPDADDFEEVPFD